MLTQPNVLKKNTTLSLRQHTSLELQHAVVQVYWVPFEMKGSTHVTATLKYEWALFKKIASLCPFGEEWECLQKEKISTHLYSTLQSLIVLLFHLSQEIKPCVSFMSVGVRSCTGLISHFLISYR